jgi:hypothetical protein
LTDGIDTAIRGPEVKEGLPVVTGIKVTESQTAASSSASPFVPQIRPPRR